uniref:Uncharacterized protein n=1 Tax=Dulem virus 42 TaxID=3145760 RepID=A0AAU8B7W9_9CAUD
MGRILRHAHIQVSFSHSSCLPSYLLSSIFKLYHHTVYDLHILRSSNKLISYSG